MIVQEDGPKVPIGGWLILVAIVLWATSIIAPISVIVELAFPHALPPLPETEAIIYSIGISVISIVSLVHFTGRKKAFIPWFVGMQAWAILYYIVIVVTRAKININLFDAVLDAVLIAYVLRSKRVKTTFVRH